MSLFLYMMIENVLISFFYKKCVLFSQHLLPMRLSFQLYFHLICHRLIDCKCVGCCMGLLSCSFYLYVCFCASSCTRDSVILYYSVKSENAKPWSLFFLKTNFLLFGFFRVSYINFKITPFYFCDKFWYFVGISLLNL